MLDGDANDGDCDDILDKLEQIENNYANCQLIKVDGNGDLLEAKILKKLSHPAVVDVIEVLNMSQYGKTPYQIFYTLHHIFFQLFSSPSYFLLVMDFCPGEQLWNLVHCNPGGLPQPISCVLFKQVFIKTITQSNEDGHGPMQFWVAREYLKRFLATLVALHFTPVSK